VHLTKRLGASRLSFPSTLSKWRISACLLLLAFGAVVIHGYHPYAEDAEIYLPGVEKTLHPELFPVHADFFQTQGGLTVFPRLLAASIRWSHLPFDYALFCWHLVSIFLLLLAAWQLSGKLLKTQLARWGAVALMAALLTLPVAGTALYIMDQYVNPRNLAAFAGLFAVATTLERKLVRALLWAAFAIAVHPLMGWFALSFCGLWLAVERCGRAPLNHESRQASFAMLLVLPTLFVATSPAYHEAGRFHGFHYLKNWEWYEWLGAIAPALIFWWVARFADQGKLDTLARTCRALVIYNVLYFAAALVISIPSRFESLARIQPLRSLHLVYMLLIVVGGGLIAEKILKAEVWRWGILFLPLCIGMFVAQRSLFPASDHIEWPWLRPRNQWAQAFLWIRGKTPTNAVFAMDPLYIRIAGEDTVAFRPLAERSSIADGYKDSGTVSMFPPLADLWWEQFQAQKDWKNFGRPDFARLHDRYGVNWVVLQSPGVPGLDCPYRNSAASVCRVIGP
jgi:hypothetical protein